MYRIKFWLCVVAIVLTACGPMLALVAITGWSPFGLFDPLHRWVEARKEHRLQHRQEAITAAEEP